MDGIKPCNWFKLLTQIPESHHNKEEVFEFALKELQPLSDEHRQALIKQGQRLNINLTTYNF